MDEGTYGDRCRDRDRRGRSLFYLADPHIRPFPPNPVDRRRECPCRCCIVDCQTLELIVRLPVVTARVVAHHAMRIHEVTERSNRCLHAVCPTPGNSIWPAIIKRRDHVALKDVV